MHLMLTINKTLQNNTEINDVEILYIIYNNGFTQEFIAEYGDVFFSDNDESVLSEADVLYASETRILERIRNLHTIY